MNKGRDSVFRRLESILMITLYSLKAIFRVVYLTLLFMKYYIALRIRWRLSLYRAKKLINKLDFDKMESDDITKSVVGDFPSIRKLYNMFRESIGNE